MKAIQILNMAVELSIVIVNWNAGEFLRNCLDSIRKNTATTNLRTIVIDNASTDGSREMVQTEFREILLINSGGNLGFAKANNLAKPHIKSPLVLFLNPDTIVPEKSIDKMIEFMNANPSIGGVGCKMKYLNGEVQPLGLQWFPSPVTELLQLLFLSTGAIQALKKHLPYQDPNQSGYVALLSGGCLMVRRDVLEHVSFFDERFFMYGEDYDLCRKIILGGWKVYYLSEAEIFHICGGTSRNTSNNFSILMKCESLSKLMHKYYGVKGKTLYRGVVFFGSSVRLAILLILKLFSIVSPEMTKEYRKSFNKYLSMIKWSVNLAKPVIRK